MIFSTRPSCRNARVRLSAFKGLAKRQGQIRFGWIVLESKSEVLFARNGRQNLLDAVKPTIDVAARYEHSCRLPVSR